MPNIAERFKNRLKKPSYNINGGGYFEDDDYILTTNDKIPSDPDDEYKQLREYQETLLDKREFIYNLSGDPSCLDKNKLVESLEYPNLTDLTIEGYNQRAEFVEKFVKEYGIRDYKASDAGILAEIEFADTILKTKFNVDLGTYEFIKDSTILQKLLSNKYLDDYDANGGEIEIQCSGNFYFPIDFIGDNFAVEIKGVQQQNYPQPAFFISYKKLEEVYNINKPHIYIYFYVVKNYDEYIERGGGGGKFYFINIGKYKYKKNMSYEQFKKNFTKSKYGDNSQCQILSSQLRPVV